MDGTGEVSGGSSLEVFTGAVGSSRMEDQVIFADTLIGVINDDHGEGFAAVSAVEADHLQ